MSLPTIVGKISHSNYWAKSAISSLFLTAKNVEVSPGAGWSCQGTNTRLVAQRRLNMLKKGAEERTKTFWFRNHWLFGPRNIYSPLWTKCFSFLFFLFPFFFCRTFSCRGKHQSPALQEQDRTRSFGQAWPWSACTVRKKGCISSQKNASAPKGVPCRRRALFVIIATNLNKPSNCRRSFPCKMLVWSSSSIWQGEVSSS